MKKSIFLLFLIVVIFSLLKLSFDDKSIVENKEEIRAIYISYIELSEYFNGKDEEEAKDIVKKIVNNIKDNNFNLIILQVRSFSDSIYKSSIFPVNYSINRDEDIILEYDLLEIFIEYSHKCNIKIHAWINPFRIRNETDISSISINNPAYNLLNTNSVKIIDNKGIYYNPADNSVQELILEGINEIISNYDIDGILFDDYFYPSDDIDLLNYEEYKISGGILEIDDYRLEVISKFIGDVYKIIKEKNKDILFGISPDGNIENNYSIHYLDVYKLLSNNGYIDYIMPQIYYGFNHEFKPFTRTVNEWNSYIKNKDISLIVALSLYKSNSVDEYAGSGNREWVEYNNIIKNQILISRNMSNYLGFSIFRYDNYFKDNSMEVENLRKLLK